MISQNIQSQISGQPTRGRETAQGVVEQRLQAALRGPVAEFMGRGGKRIRAEIVGLAYRVASRRHPQSDCPEALFEFLELMHAGTLVIDDVQDGSRMRRGRESLHVTHGVPLAINAGNWMYFAALERLAGLELPPETLCELLQRSLTVFKLGHEGQALDLSVRVSQLPQNAVPEVVEQISTLKTGAFTELAAWVGAKVAGGGMEDVNAIAEFGLNLGIALQMRNDWGELQRAAECEALSADLLNQRATWPWAWLALSLPSVQYRTMLGRLQHAPGEQTQIARQIFEQIGIYANNEIHSKLEEAASSLGQLDLDADARTQMNELLALLEPN
ncbi:MAG: polyprenyl synthetase family protein, partial [Planctomycetota bacterium]